MYNNVKSEEEVITPIMKINDLATLGRFILSPECKSVVILSGAGISVASGM